MLSGAFHHIDISVSHLRESTEFYDGILRFMGFRRSQDTAEGYPIWAGATAELGLMPARNRQPHDRYAPGLHHLAFSAPDRAAVDRLYEYLVSAAVKILDSPAQYEQYAPGYYAVFFADPDGIKLEYVFTPVWPV